MRNKKEGMNSFQQAVFNAILNVRGVNNMLTIPEPILHFAGDLPSGAFLSQLIYWCDKGKSRDGYIYKTYKEWKRETLLSEYQIRKAADKLCDMGILHKKLKKANGQPTVHYKLDLKAFGDAFLKFLRREPEDFKKANLKSKECITEPSSETSSELTKKDTREFCKKPQNSAVSFKEYCKRFSLEDTEAVQTIQYFLEVYKISMGAEHPRLKPEQWQSVVDTIMTCEDVFGGYEDLSLDDLEAMIDKYFGTEFQDGCNYSILHFNNDGVKVRRMYEVAY